MDSFVDVAMIFKYRSNLVPYFFLLHISHPFCSKTSKIVTQFPRIFFVTPLAPAVNCLRSKGVKPVNPITPKIRLFN
ncbi:hypothetical protein BpHYR1_050140 [Brachionus plicatilis]|uniref:Uncharacterized protein n=1 Tax=Brachionus plicatilis TaxID=10195 RepID=A0A3M7PQE7_BRAPC|nr:hypothetical protein BpHYR1_050140 [Brachionus plicatilis]